MGEDRLEEFMKDKVFDHQTPADINAIWEGILTKQEADKPKKRRFLWFWLLPGLLLIASITTYAILGAANKKQTSTLDHNHQISNEQQTPDALTNHSTDGLNSPSLGNAKNLAETFFSNENEVSDSTILDKNQPVSTTVYERLFETTARPIETNEAHQATAVSLTQGINSPVNTPPSAVDLKAPFIDSELVVLTSDVEAVETSEESVERANPNSVITTINEPLDIATVRPPIVYLVSLELIDPNPKSIAHSDQVNSFDATIKRKKISPLSIGAYLDYGASSRQLNSQNGEGEDYIKRRNELETPEQVFSGGFDLQYQFQSGLFLKSGLAYEQITECFDLDKTTSPEAFFNEDAISIIYQLSDGTTTSQFGTNSTIQHINKRKIFNRYRTIDLPLLVGYSSKPKNRLSWFVEGGVSINLAFMPRGEILTNDEEETIIDLSNTAILRNNIGVSINTGLGLSFHLNNKWSMWLSPRFRYALSSMTTNAYPLEQSFARGALQLGVRKGL